MTPMMAVAPLIAAALQAISPLAIASSVRILSDSLYAFMLVLAIVLLVHYGRTGKQWPLLAACVTAALACYVRPIDLLWLGLVLLTLAWRLVADMRRGEWREPARALVVAAVTFTAVLAPWVVRNGQATGYWGFCSISTTNLFRYEAAGTLAAVEGIGLTEAQGKLERQLEDQPPGTRTPLERIGRQRQIAMDVISAHPWTWLRTHVTTSLASLLPGTTDVLEVAGARPAQQGTLSVLQHEGLVAAVRHYFGGAWWAFWLSLPAVLVLAAKYAMAVVAMVRRGQKGLIFWTILVFLLAGGAASTARFRVPVEPLINLAAAVGLAILFRNRVGLKPRESLTS